MPRQKQMGTDWGLPSYHPLLKNTMGMLDSSQMNPEVPHSSFIYPITRNSIKILISNN